MHSVTTIFLSHTFAHKTSNNKIITFYDVGIVSSSTITYCGSNAAKRSEGDKSFFD